ncbi:Short-chain dehydrogenase/reductase SDR [Penicillium sp. IBT 35674x]|nr:Short-chain dehydrogenase/reductase SDR [Penicillium sp. IBT 35674x]
MEGTVIITGVTGSMAIEAVQQLLSSHPHLIVVGTVRDANKCPNNPQFLRLDSIRQQYPERRLILENVDLNSLKNVRYFADRISGQVTAGELPSISAVICNAFTWSLERGQQFSSDHYESTFQVNHLAHYLLVLKLLPSMNRKSGRIIMLGSEIHNPEHHHNPLSRMGASLPTEGNLEELIKPGPDSPGAEHDMGWRRYANSKLANVMFIYSLNQRLQNDKVLNAITAVAMDPGAIVDSRAHQIHGRFTNKMVSTMMKLLHPVLALFTH